jgi:hypothetical protein
MALATRPSLQGRFSLVYSGDPALQPRPADLPEATPEEQTTRKKEQEDFDAALNACRETGQWASMIIPGAAPTVFSFALPRGEEKRALLDAFVGLMVAGKATLAASRLFRATFKDATNWPGPKITFVRDDGIQLVNEDVVEFLDEQVTPAVIGEFGTFIYERLKGPSGK